MDEWFLVSVQYVPSEREIVWACLYCHDCLGLEETAPGACRAYFPSDVARDPILSELRHCEAVLDMSSSILPSENWHSRWMKNYRSFRVEPFLIRPSWEAAQFEPGLVEVVMDPKGAFGTGTHETSQMCLKYLPRVVAGRRSALDLGCGSGILSIALCKLAARLCVLALDNDFQACQVCRDNREINDVRFSIACGEISTTRGMFDLIVANLQMDLLLKLLPDFLERTLPGAILVLSGLLGEQIDPVRHLYDNSLRLQHLERQGDWAAVVYSRP